MSSNGCDTCTRGRVRGGHLSIDKDFFQMVGDGIRVYDPREDGAWFDSDGVVRILA